MLDILSRQPRCATLVPFEFIVLLGALVLPPMSGKRQKLPTKRGRASEDPTPNFDVTRFDRPKTRCVKYVPKCASARVAPSNIVYLSYGYRSTGKGELTTEILLIR